MNISFKSSVEGFVFYSFAPDKREKITRLQRRHTQRCTREVQLARLQILQNQPKASALLLASVDNHGGKSLCGFLQQLHDILWSKITLISEVAAAAVRLKSSIPLSLSC